MKDFFVYFFGKGETEEFRNFSLAHFLPILLAVGVIYLMYRYREKIAAWKHEPKLRMALALTMIVCEMSYFWRLACYPELGGNAVDHLPITVCGWSVIFCSYMLTSRSQGLFDIAYFWLFSGTLFALITPTVITYTGPTRFRYYQFWLEHTLGYVAIFYAIFVMKLRPTLRSLRRSYIALAVLAVIAYVANSVIGPGANYLFMAKPEDTPSILDILPPIFWLRILIMAAAITALFVLSYLPWWLTDRKRGKGEQAADTPETVEEKTTVEV